jgi:hypothetical protein
MMSDGPCGQTIIAEIAGNAVFEVRIAMSETCSYPLP